MRTLETHNGLEVLLTSQLLIDLLDNYNAKGLVRNRANMFIKELEKVTVKNYNEIYSRDPEYVTNFLNLKQRMITQIAEFNEADCALFSDFLNNFVENIEVAREKGIIYFDKIL